MGVRVESECVVQFDFDWVAYGGFFRGESGGG